MQNKNNNILIAKYKPIITWDNEFNKGYEEYKLTIPDKIFDIDKFKLVNFEVLKNKIITDIHIIENSEGLVFIINNDKCYILTHLQECCENVSLEDIEGDLIDLLNEEILLAEEVSEYGRNGNEESGTWTFYKLATIKGSVTLRFIGESNGFYSEAVHLYEC